MTLNLVKQERLRGSEAGLEGAVVTHRLILCIDTSSVFLSWPSRSSLPAGSHASRRPSSPWPSVPTVPRGRHKPVEWELRPSMAGGGNPVSPLGPSIPRYLTARGSQSAFTLMGQRRGEVALGATRPPQVVTNDCPACREDCADRSTRVGVSTPALIVPSTAPPRDGAEGMVSLEASVTSVQARAERHWWQSEGRRGEQRRTDGIRESVSGGPGGTAVTDSYIISPSRSPGLSPRCPC